MKTKLLLISFFLVFVTGCTKSVDPVSPENDVQPNRLIASSFETEGTASIDNWKSPGPPIVKFSRDVPQEGGNFSIFLKARSLGAFVSKEVDAINGKHNYRLTYWSKSTEDPGSLSIFNVKGNTKTLIKAQNITVDKWTKYSFVFQVNAANGEKIQILLGGSDFVSPQGYTFFDLITLENLD